MRHLQDYQDIIGNQVKVIQDKAQRLQGRTVLHLNSTYHGGGVAEMLKTLVPLMCDIGLRAEWRVLKGSDPFFHVTKKIHNTIQGEKGDLSEEEKELYLEINASYSEFSKIDHDFVVVHDPQPLPQIRFHNRTQPWIWRCHIDLANPNKNVWDYLKTFCPDYDLMFISNEKFKKQDAHVPQKVVMPSIDPLSPKNIFLSDSHIKRLLKENNVPTDKPILTQVSRFDPWKDPEGVLEVYKRIKKQKDCRLVFCYNLASDDPEGVTIYERMLKAAKEDLDNGNVLFVRGDDPLLVNAIQRASSIIMQKSLREGFGLTVTEGMWKKRPVVASDIGGIPLQIQDGENGCLIDPNDHQGTADRIVHLLSDPVYADKLGENAKETVREKFLITRLLSDYLDVMNESLVEKRKAPSNRCAIPYFPSNPSITNVAADK